MADQLYVYDPGRIAALTLRTAAAIEHLDATTSDEPSAADAIRTIREIAHRLSTTWMPLLVNIGNDTSMTAWSTGGPEVWSTSTAGTANALGFMGGTSAPPDGKTPDELAAEFQSVVTGGNGRPRFDGPFGSWFRGLLNSVAYQGWGGEDVDFDQLESDDSYAIPAFSASYNIGTLNMSIPSDGVNDPSTAERLYNAGIQYDPFVAPSDSGGWGSLVTPNCDGVVVTVVALTSEPYFDSGQPSTLEVAGANLGVVVAGAILTGPYGAVEAAVVGAASVPVVSSMLEPDADQAVFETWSLVTPVNASGEIVGEPRLVQIPVAVECSSEEQFEQIQMASDGGVPPIIPTYGSTFVVMTHTEVEVS